MRQYVKFEAVLLVEDHPYEDRLKAYSAVRGALKYGHKNQDFSFAHLKVKSFGEDDSE